MPYVEPHISAVVPAFQDLGPLLRTLSCLTRCNPSPSEILVHVDGGNPEILASVRNRYPSVRLLASSAILGPGGSRNQLIASARHQWIANFDDDSFPAHVNYFGRVAALIERFPHAAILSAASHPAEWRTLDIKKVGIFSGCGCVFRKSLFEELGGFVPLPIAYGMEELDLSLRIHAADGLLVHDPLLRVRHQPDPDRVRDHQVISSAVLANTALFPFLRFPWSLQALGLYHVMTRIIWMIKQGHRRSILPGLKQIPRHLWAHRNYRNAVTATSLRSWHHLRHHPENLHDGTDIANAWQEDGNWET
jgi:glycosyltransferase involved in cell wall biosynthesis